MPAPSWSRDLTRDALARPSLPKGGGLVDAPGRGLVGLKGESAARHPLVRSPPPLAASPCKITATADCIEARVSVFLPLRGAGSSACFSSPQREAIDVPTGSRTHDPATYPWPAARSHDARASERNLSSPRPGHLPAQARTSAALHGRSPFLAGAPCATVMRGMNGKLLCTTCMHKPSAGTGAEAVSQQRKRAKKSIDARAEASINAGKSWPPGRSPRDQGIGSLQPSRRAIMN
jgi:hypothetical protein